MSNMQPALDTWSSRLTYNPLKRMVPRGGVEPPTHGFSGHCYVAYPNHLALPSPSNHGSERHRDRSGASSVFCPSAGVC